MIPVRRRKKIICWLWDDPYKFVINEFNATQCRKPVTICIFLVGLGVPEDYTAAAWVHSRHRYVALSSETCKKKGLITSPERLVPGKLYLPLLFVSQKVQLLLRTRSHCGFLMHHASQRICCSNTIVVPLVSCLCWCTTADSVSSGQHSLSSHSSMATPARGGWFPPPLTPCRDCLLLYPGASPCAMLSGSKTLWEACHLIRLITIVVLDFT